MNQLSEEEWLHLARKIIKLELAKGDTTYEELVQRLEALGVNETYAGVTNKISRGTFSFAFFLQCMKALKKKVVKFDL